MDETKTHDLSENDLTQVSGGANVDPYMQIDATPCDKFPKIGRRLGADENPLVQSNHTGN